MVTRERSQTFVPTPSSRLSGNERVVALRTRSMSMPGVDVPIAVAITTPVRRSSLFAETSKSPSNLPPLPPAYTATPSHSRNFSVPSTSSRRHSVHHSRSNPNMLQQQQRHRQSPSTHSIHSNTTRSNPNLVSSFNNNGGGGGGSGGQEVTMVLNAPPLMIPPRTLSNTHNPHSRTFSMHDIPVEEDRIASSSPPPPYTAPSSTTHRARAFSLFSATSPTSPHARNPCPHERTRGVVRVRDEESGVEYDVESGRIVGDATVVEGQNGVRTLISGRPMTMDEYKSARQRRKWYILACGTGIIVVLAVAISQLYGVWNGNDNK